MSERVLKSSFAYGTDGEGKNDSIPTNKPAQLIVVKMIILAEESHASREKKDTRRTSCRSIFARREKRAFARKQFIGVLTIVHRARWPEDIVVVGATSQIDRCLSHAHELTQSSVVNNHTKRS